MGVGEVGCIVVRRNARLAQHFAGLPRLMTPLPTLLPFAQAPHSRPSTPNPHLEDLVVQHHRLAVLLRQLLAQHSHLVGGEADGWVGAFVRVLKEA